ncbi:MAG: hypothetical protein JWM36_4825 [Hyphomicrobiales bacterium]|nr:hypothetical protein [Hyphomicrobiales bacterium]
MTKKLNEIAPDNPPEDQPCCFNCRYLGWYVGVGQGIRCKNTANKNNSDLTYSDWQPLIPSRRYLCGLFEFKARSEMAPNEWK